MSESIDLNVNLLKSILWQYENADKLKALVIGQQEWVNENHTEFWTDWVRDVFNIDTANDFGLLIWSKILKVKTSVDLGSTNVPLSTEQNRLLIRARYFSLTNSPTVGNINQFLKKYFWRGDAKVYVTDKLDMTFALYNFHYQPGSELAFLIDNTDVLPRPATLGVKVRIISKIAFGFGAHRANFTGNFGNIIHDEIL